MDHLGVSDEMLGERMDKSRTTVWRWRTDQKRLKPEIWAQIAEALGISPESLHRHPTDISLDEMLKDEPEAVRKAAVDYVIFLKQRAP